MVLISVINIRTHVNEKLNQIITTFPCEESVENND